MAIIDNLVSYYKLDEDSGAVVDSHGSNNGTNNGATTGATGKINHCYDFDGISDFVSIPNAVITGTAGSISAWIYVDALTGEPEVIVGAGIDYDPWIWFSIANDGDLVFQSQVTGMISTGAGTITTGSWYHVVYTSDGTNSHIYVNGVDKNLTIPNDDGIWFDDIAFTLLAIGVLDRTNNYGEFDGKIDEVGFWERAITQTEVTQLYNNGSGLAYHNFTYKQERSAGNLKLGKGLFGKSLNTLFTKSTASGEIKVKTSTGSTQKIIDINTSYNSSSTEIETTTTAWGSMLTKTHKSNTGKVMVIANTPLTASGAGGFVDLRLTKSGNLIPGSTIWKLFHTGDGAISTALMGFIDVDIDKTYTYALQWREGESETPFTAGFTGTGSSYNILIQDII